MLRTRILALALFTTAVWASTTATTSPVDDIPVFQPVTTIRREQEPGQRSTPLDPLGPARNPKRTGSPLVTLAPLSRGSKRPRPPPATRVPVSSVSASTTRARPVQPRLESSPSASTTQVYKGSECGASYAFGSAAVSVKGHGTFCAFTPVCSGAAMGHCPGKQPGLDVASRCEVLPSNVNGCVAYNSTV